MAERLHLLRRWWFRHFGTRTMGRCVDCGAALTFEECTFYGNTCERCESIDHHALTEAQECAAPPRGWWCSREAGHGGPCAARPDGVEVPSRRCAGCDIQNGCPEFCRCAPGVRVGSASSHAVLMREAAAHLREHNADYKHRTPEEFIARLEATAGVVGQKGGA